jgi:hypothetical protein
MASSSVSSSNQTGNIFNHQYRVRPTTVDQKRVKIFHNFDYYQSNLKTDVSFLFKKALPRSSKPQISTIIRPLTTSLDQQKRPVGLGKKSKTTFREARGVDKEPLQRTSDAPEEDQLPVENSAREELQNGEALTDDAANLLNESEVLVRDDNAEDGDRRNSMSDADNDDFLNDDKWDTDIEKEG